MNDQIVIINCKGCYGDFTGYEINKDGYCDSCQYEIEAKQDDFTGGDDE